MSNKIFESLLNIMNDVEAIGKNKKNDTQNYKFRGIDDMYNALHPLFSKHGVLITSEVLKAEREERTTAKGGFLMYSILDVKFTFYASDGSNISSTLRGEGMDSGDKASNKSQSVALKYALMQMFLIPTDDLIDPDKTSPEPKSKEEKNQPKKEEKKQPSNGKPAMTEKPFKQALERIKGGEIGVPQKCYDAFLVTDDQRKQLDECKPDQK